MKSVLRDGGVLIFDQGQTDAFLKAPQKFILVGYNRKLIPAIVGRG
jgi:hypothetical protein